MTAKVVLTRGTSGFYGIPHNPKMLCVHGAKFWLKLGRNAPNKITLIFTCKAKSRHAFELADPGTSMTGLVRINGYMMKAGRDLLAKQYRAGYRFVRVMGVERKRR